MWTDVLQAVIMLAAIIAVMVKGTIEVGGFDVVWERNLESGRLDVPPYVYLFYLRKSYVNTKY